MLPLLLLLLLPAVPPPACLPAAPLRRPSLPPDMALLLAAARIVVGNCLTRTAAPVVCSAVPPLQQQQCRDIAKFKCHRKKHREKLALVYVKGRPSLHPVEKFKNLYSGEAGVPVLEISGTGSVFDTEIKRRTTVRDPNAPKARPFEPQKECLQWTDWRMLRDVNRRIATAELHPTRKNLICVRKAHQLPQELREQAFKEIVHKLPLKAGPCGVHNRCVVTSRGRGKFLMFRMSRIFWRLQADYNKLSGAMKSMWGP